MEEGFQPELSNEQLWREVAELKERVVLLERALNGSAPPSPRLSRAEPAPVARDAKPAATFPSVSPAASAGVSMPLDRSGQPSALETKIGAQLFNRVGVFAVLAGAAWFLKLAIDRAWIGPGVRVAIGLLVAVALVAWSERFRRGGAVVFSNTLKALGSGIAYLSLWAAVNLYQLFAESSGFLAMVAVTATNAVLAWWQDSELLAALALAGGLATPALLSNGGDRELFLFAYLLLLDIGVLALMALRPWARLALGAFFGTTVYLAAWWLQYSSYANETLTGVFVGIFFALFTLVPLLGLRRKVFAPIDRLLTGLPVAVGFCALLEGRSVLSSAKLESETWWVAFALGVAYFVLTIFVRPHATPAAQLARSLRLVHLGLAVAFFAIAGWLTFHGDGIVLSWLAEFVIVAVAAVRLSGGELAKPLRGSVSALLLLSLSGLLALEAYDPLPSGTSAFWNSHFAVYLAGLAAFAVVTALSRENMSSETQGASLEVDSWPFLAGFATIAFNLVALFAVSLQIELYWRQQLLLTPRSLRAALHPAYVDFTYSAWFMLYGAALMAAGFIKRIAFLRWQALILLSVSIAKVFLFDISHLNEGYRVFSFLGLGVLLLTVSFAYQRDWLGLFGKRD
jgi:uncharacterized membrane protein